MDRGVRFFGLLILWGFFGCAAPEAVSLATQEILTLPGSPRTPCPPGTAPCTDMYFVAHYDDDIYFMNPDIETSLKNGNNVVVVYVSGAGQGDSNAGLCTTNANCPQGSQCDQGLGHCVWTASTHELYWTNRERGILDAYAQMTDPAQSWTPGLTRPTWVGKEMAIFTHPLSSAYPNKVVTLLFMRLADTSLEALWSSRTDAGVVISGYKAPRFQCGLVPAHCPINAETVMSAGVDYTRAELIQVLTNLMSAYDATSISTLDASNLDISAFTDPHPVAPFTDNGSHYVVGLFTLAAAQQFQALSTHSVFLRFYRGYSLYDEPVNLSTAQQTEKGRIAGYYGAWDCIATSGLPCAAPNPPGNQPACQSGASCSAPGAFGGDTRSYAARSILGTGPLQGRIALKTSTTQPYCLTTSGTAVTITTSCASAPQWIITSLNQIQLAGTSNCLRADTSTSQILLAACGSTGRDWSTFFVMSNGQIRAREPDDTRLPLPSLFPPNPSGSCLQGNPNGTVTYGYCSKNCINKKSGQIDPSCTSSNSVCQYDSSIDGYDRARIPPLGQTNDCGGVHLGSLASEACLPGLNGDSPLHCFATAAGTPISWQDWSLVFDPPVTVSSDFSNSTEVANGNTYYRTFGIVDKNVCVRRSSGVSCARSDLAFHAGVGYSSSYQATPWAAANAVDGGVNSTGSTFGFSSGLWGSAPAYLEIDLPSIMRFDRVILYPRNDSGNVGVGFPISFRIQVWNGATWLDRVTVNNYPVPSNQGQVFAWSGDTTDKVRIYATTLPYTSSGYVMQFAEVEVYNYAGSSLPSLASAQQLTTSFSDYSGWNPDQNGSTVKGVWDSNAQQTIACGRGYYGISCSNGLSTSDYSDSAGWAAARYYYDSVRYVDVNGDGRPDVCARGYYGVSCSLNQTSSFSSSTLWSSDFSQAWGWNASGYGDTMLFADVDGDGKTDVCGRGASGFECSLGNGTTSFSDHHDWSFYSDRRYPTGQADFGDGDAAAFPGSQYRWQSSMAYFGSLKLVDINRDGFADVCGRSSNGTYCAFGAGNRFERKRQVLLYPEDFTDAQGWGTESNGTTMSFGDLNGDSRTDLCARANGGIVCTSGY